MAIEPNGGDAGNESIEDLRKELEITKQAMIVLYAIVERSLPGTGVAAQNFMIDRIRRLEHDAEQERVDKLFERIFEYSPPET